MKSLEVCTIQRRCLHCCFMFVLLCVELCQRKNHLEGQLPRTSLSTVNCAAFLIKLSWHFLTFDFFCWVLLVKPAVGLSIIRMWCQVALEYFLAWEHQLPARHTMGSRSHTSWHVHQPGPAQIPSTQATVINSVWPCLGMSGQSASFALLFSVGHGCLAVLARTKFAGVSWCVSL